MTEPTPKRIPDQDPASQAGTGWLMTSLDPNPLIVSLVQVASSLPLHHRSKQGVYETRSSPALSLRQRKPEKSDTRTRQDGCRGRLDHMRRIE